MLAEHPTNIAVYFSQIHSIITRGLRVSCESIQEAQAIGFKDRNSQDGLFKYLLALVAVLNGHHRMEDDQAFPYFRDKLPEAPFDNLTAWHQKMVVQLDEIKGTLDGFEKNAHPEAALASLAGALDWLRSAWRPHIQSEEIEFVVKADDLVSVDEQLRLVRLFKEYSQKLAEPLYLTIPFQLYNLPEEHRQEFSRGMDKEVLQNLVPIFWKEKWESMEPFLLIDNP